jgi:uncharacterized OB-fold protein
VAVLPAVTDPDTAGFFAAAAGGRLVVRRCSDCDAVLHMPVAYCRHCGGFDGRWAEVAPSGRIYSYTVVAHQVHPDFPVPHTIVLVELDDVTEVRLVGHLDGRPEVYVGQPVVAEFRQLSAGAALPTWRLRDERG